MCKLGDRVKEEGMFFLTLFLWQRLHMYVRMCIIYSLLQINCGRLSVYPSRLRLSAIFGTRKRQFFLDETANYLLLTTAQAGGFPQCFMLDKHSSKVRKSVTCLSEIDD